MEHCYCRQGACCWCGDVESPLTTGEHRIVTSCFRPSAAGQRHLAEIAELAERAERGYATFEDVMAAHSHA